MREKAKAAGRYLHELTGRSVDKISIVTIRSMIEGGVHLELPQDFAAFKAAVRQAEGRQMELPLSDEAEPSARKQAVASGIRSDEEEDYALPSSKPPSSKSSKAQ